MVWQLAHSPVTPAIAVDWQTMKAKASPDKRVVVAIALW